VGTVSVSIGWKRARSSAVMSVTPLPPGSSMRSAASPAGTSTSAMTSTNRSRPGTPLSARWPSCARNGSTYPANSSTVRLASAG
jgi:hypothetical protein